MDETLISRRDLDFLLHEWLDVAALCERPLFASHSRETFDAMLDLSARLAAAEFLPHYKKSDQVEPRFAEGRVTTLPEIGRALTAYAAAGLPGASFDEALGGQQFPNAVHTASLGIFMAANVATSAYPMLSAANARLIARFGARAQIETFALPQIEGRWLGTMCLSEPQAGSSLGDISTRAVADGEGAVGKRFRLTGHKMWISGGDHDLSDNIVHLVLAKIVAEDRSLPSGSKGISLFIVPKFLTEKESGERNDVVVAGLNHKMGYRGATNCLLNFGEGAFRPGGEAGAVGYLIGKAGQGLAIMFQMMNEARISVGLGAAALGYRGALASVRYARERPQGRAMGSKSDKPSPIIEHPDVRRMLLAQKAYAEGALALVLYAARLVDEERTAPTADAREEAADLLGLLTPVAKTWPSEYGLAANDLAIQIHGGYGYTRDFEVEQLYRDNRLNPIHEGTTGIQALDLLGRKIIRGGDRALPALERRVRSTLTAARGHDDLAHHARALEQVLSEIFAVAEQARALRDATEALQNATAFLSAFGHFIVGWIWLEQALAAQAGVQATGASKFYEGKLRTCRYFYECELPKVKLWLTIVASLSDVCGKADTDLL
jgi:alkylation response protein AidB-like acyl-CoA dehydrogenase